MAYPYSPNQVLLMDGLSTPPKDLIVGPGTAYTMAGTPATATVLGATAPTIGAASYTSCKIATPFAAGSALSILLVVNTAWAGNDGATHVFFDARDGDTSGGLDVQKLADGTTITHVYGGADYYTGGAVNATNWPAGTHILIATFAADGTQALYLDGTQLTGTAVGTKRRESAVGTTVKIGTYWNLTSSRVEGSMLTAIWTRILTSAEITALSSLTAWSTLTTPVASGRRRRSKAVLGG